MCSRLHMTLPETAPPPAPTLDAEVLPPVAPRSSPGDPLTAPGAAAPRLRTAGATETSGAATASLVLGIAATLCGGPLLGIPAIICGHAARSAIKRSKGTIGGTGMAMAGLIMGYLSLVWLMLGILLFAVGYVTERQVVSTELDAVQSHSCVNSMRMIDSAKEQGAVMEALSDGDEVAEAQISEFLPSGMPICPQGGVYSLNPVGADPHCSEHGGMSENF